MDILGKKGEEATESLEDFQERMNKLESHLNAVDSALQDFVDNYSRILQGQLDYHEDELVKLRDIVEDNSEEEEEDKEIKQRLRKVEDRLDSQRNQLRELIETDLETSFEDVVKGLKKTRQFMRETRNRVDEVEKKVDELEGELYVEINNRDFDFEQKLDKRDYQDEKESMEEEIKKLKASVHTLADQLDSRDDIEVE
ncbi:MAG: hypothetical protein ABEJ99_01965 [Candidatus Nanohaloarchaea archaeon]